MLLLVLRLCSKQLEKRVHTRAGAEVPFRTPMQGDLPLTEGKYTGLDRPLEKSEVFC